MIWQRVQFDQITKRYTAGWLAGQSPEEMDAAIAVSEVIEGRAVTRDALKGELLPYKIGNDYALKYTCFVDEGVDEDKAFAAAGHPAPTTSKDTVIALAHGLINAGLARVSAATAGEQDQLAELQSLVAAPKSEFKGALAPKVK
jgi:hypothetical protein